MGALALALSVAGCGGASTPTKQAATGAVTPQAGGTVALPDKSVKLDVPAGAVSSNTTLTMTTTDATAPQGITAVSPIMQFGPDGTVFSKPITVTFTFKNATSPVVFWSNGRGGYDLIPGTVSGSTISAPVTHFSTGFVGEQPAGSSDKCGAGVACGAGTTCGFGGTPSGTNSGGSGTNDPGSGGTQTGGGGSTMSGGGFADASAPAPTDPGAPKTSALSAGSDDGGAPMSTSGGTATGGTTGMCCSCVNGVFQCSTCTAPSSGDGSNKDAGVSICAEGASCSQPGAVCGTTVSGGGGTNTGAPMSGASSGDGTGAQDASVNAGSTGPTGTGTAPAGSTSMCCTCGSDGKMHCGTSCGAPSADGGTTGTGGGTDASLGGGSGHCEPGDPCQPGSAGCQNASPTSCLACVCGSDGHLACMPCSDHPPPPSDGGTPTSQCAPGATCQAGAACGGNVNGQCVQCKCDANGALACGPCATALDAGAPPPGGGACVPGGACTAGPSCGAKTQDGSCLQCTCGSAGTYQCTSCSQPPPPQDGSAPPPSSTCMEGGACGAGEICDGKTPAGACLICKCDVGGTFVCAPCAPPPTDASAPPPPPQGCMQGAKCPTPGGMCMGADAQGACTQCTCLDTGLLSCTPCP